MSMMQGTTDHFFIALNIIPGFVLQMYADLSARHAPNVGFRGIIASDKLWANIAGPLNVAQINIILIKKLFVRHVPAVFQLCFHAG